MLFKITVLCALLNVASTISVHPILIIVSYDAFKLYDIEYLPNMIRLRNSGTYADYMFNVFPTKTFPNHHSTATGFYPETHGVIGNSYIDMKTQTLKRISTELYSYNEDIKPIWRWNEDHGRTRHSGAMMWPGTSFPYQGKTITYLQDYDHNMDWHVRVDMIISWLLNKDKPANLIMFYLEEPDTHGHALGTHAQEFKNILKKLDDLTAYLEDQLQKHGLSDAHVIHISDHGLLNVSPPRFINVSQHLIPNTCLRAGSSPFIQLYPKPGFEEAVYKKLKKGMEITGHFYVYKREEFPPRWHYKKCDRVPPLLVMAELGYAFDDLMNVAPKYAELYNFTVTDSSEFGVHGYDNIIGEMHPYFMARGPKIKKNHKVDPFHTVDLFNLFAEILDLPHLNNNGSFENVVDILIQKPRNYEVKSTWELFVPKFYRGIERSMDLINTFFFV